MLKVKKCLSAHWYCYTVKNVWPPDGEIFTLIAYIFVDNFWCLSAARFSYGVQIHWIIFVNENYREIIRVSCLINVESGCFYCKWDKRFFSTHVKPNMFTSSHWLLMSYYFQQTNPNYVPAKSKKNLFTKDEFELIEEQFCRVLSKSIAN